MAPSKEPKSEQLNIRVSTRDREFVEYLRDHNAAYDTDENKDALLIRLVREECKRKKIWVTEDLQRTTIGPDGKVILPEKTKKPPHETK